MTTELQRANDALERRQHTVQAALLADFRHAQDVPIGAQASEAWTLADAYRRLFVGMDLDAAEIIDHADREALAAADHVQEAQHAGQPIPFGTLARALVLDGFSLAAMLFTLRAESSTPDFDDQERQSYAAAVRARDARIDQLERALGRISGTPDVEPVATIDGARGIAHSVLHADWPPTS